MPACTARTDAKAREKKTQIGKKHGNKLLAPPPNTHHRRWERNSRKRRIVTARLGGLESKHISSSGPGLPGLETRPRDLGPHHVSSSTPLLCLHRTSKEGPLLL